MVNRTTWQLFPLVSITCLCCIALRSTENSTMTATNFFILPNRGRCNNFLHFKDNLQIHQQHFMDKTWKILETSKARHLLIETTHTNGYQNKNQNVCKINQRYAMDDFLTNYSWIIWWQRFECDVVREWKIGERFIYIIWSSTFHYLRS